MKAFNEKDASVWSFGSFAGEAWEISGRNDTERPGCLIVFVTLMLVAFVNPLKFVFFEKGA